MKAAVIVFPGSNCDRDVKVALEAATGQPARMIWHKETELPALDLIVLPGGFSYGDYLRAGAIAARSPVMRAVVAKAQSGTAVLAICNGFQVATEAGLLPGTLMRNRNQKFVCKDVHLKVETSQTAFTARYVAGQVIRLPIAHADGSYFADPETLTEIEAEGRVAFRYVTPDGAPDDDANPNGSAANIAGVFNREKTVLGLMPHPERLADPALGGTDGRAMFDSLVAALS